MTNIAASNDSHDRSERESERSPSLTSHQPVVPRHELEATEVTMWSAVAKTRTQPTAGRVIE